MRKIRIGCLTYGLLYNLTKNAIQKLKDDEIEIILLDGVMDKLVKKVREAYTDGVEVFVGGGANAELARSIEIPVVQIKLTAIDYIDALLKAKNYGQKVALVSYKKPLAYNLEKLQSITGVEIIPIVYNDISELHYLLKTSEVKVIIGASLSNEIAASLGLTSILIYPGEDAIITTIKEAKRLALALRNEKKKSKLDQAIIDFSLGGIIATDAAGKVIKYNPMAEKILAKKSENIIGYFISDVLPEIGLDDVLASKQSHIGEIKEINGVELIINNVLLEDGNEIVGTVTTFQKTTEIQKTEQKIRLLYKKKGFVAKAVFSDIIGKSSAILNEIEKAKVFAQTDSNILIYGETGVGKELFAQSIHNYSMRQEGPFVAINCAALPESLLESELFGYEEGAFTGSRKGGKMGLFEMAHTGTIFLDEIAEISLGLQARLLRVLQEKEVMRVGGDRVISVDVRIIAATNKKLEDKIPEEFRDDLYYRLNVFNLTIPPLRERKEDIWELFLCFLKKHNLKQEHLEMLLDQGNKVLTIYSWPGNIRELQNVAERLGVLYNNESKINEDVINELLITAIEENRLIDDLMKQYNYSPSENKGKNIPQEMIKKLEIVCPRSKSKIAEKLGVSRTTLWRKLNDKLP